MSRKAFKRALIILGLIIILPIFLSIMVLLLLSVAGIVEGVAESKSVMEPFLRVLVFFLVAIIQGMAIYFLYRKWKILGNFT